MKTEFEKALTCNARTFFIALFFSQQLAELADSLLNIVSISGFAVCTDYDRVFMWLNPF